MKTLINHLFQSFKVALSGLRIAAAEEPTFRTGLVAVLTVFVLMFVFPLSSIERAIICLTALSVLGMEAINTQVERTTNLIDGNYNPQIRKIKDIAAAGVLLYVLAAALVAGFIFIPHIINFFNK